MKNLKKEFAGLFYSMSVTRGRAEVWRDIVFLWAAAINNRVHYKQKVEDAYLAIIQKYTRDEQERIAEMLAIVAADMACDPEQDFLGGFYMAERLGNPRRGQYFTPYDVADMMSRITLGTAGAEIKRKGYITVNDPACGSGVMLLAGANCLRRQKIGVESNVLFVGQDIETGIAGRVSGLCRDRRFAFRTVDRECFESAGQCLGDAGLSCLYFQTCFGRNRLC